MKKISSGTVIHVGFDIGLFLKAIEAIGEILIGIGLFFVTPTHVSDFISYLTSTGFLQGSEHFIVNYIISFGDAFSESMHSFAIFYALSHGIMKIVVVLLLWKKKLWAYPLSVAVFTFFIVYQTIHLLDKHFVIFVILTILDIIMIVLTILEYKRLKGAFSN